MKWIMLKTVVEADDLSIVRRLILYEKRWESTHVYVEGSTKLALISIEMDVGMVIAIRDYLPSPASQSSMDGI